MLQKSTLHFLFACFLLVGIAPTLKAQMSKNLVKKETPLPIENREGEPELISYKDQLIALIEKDEIFLRPDVSSEDIAKRLRTSISVVEEIMLSDFGQDYDKFINSRRVTSAAEYLLHPDFFRQYFESKDQQEVILADIAMKSGFNSKGLLLRMFKKFKGLSIEEYMEQENKAVVGEE